MISSKLWLEHLRLQLPIARAGIDPEGVHQVRVAAGRLSVWLELAGLRVLRDDLSWLRHKVGPVRDLDVLLEDAQPAAWRSWLADRRDHESLELVRSLDDPRVEALIMALDLVPEIEIAQARERLPDLQRRVLQAGSRLAKRDCDLAAFHRLRRALRRWRYALDALTIEADAEKRLQADLGHLNNEAVRLRHIDAASVASEMSAVRIEEVRTAVQHSIERGRKKSLARWKKVREQIEDRSRWSCT